MLAAIFIFPKSTWQKQFFYSARNIAILFFFVINDLLFYSLPTIVNYAYFENMKKKLEEK